MSRTASNTDSPNNTSISSTSIVSPVPYGLPRPSWRFPYNDSSRESSRESSLFVDEGPAGLPFPETTTISNTSGQHSEILDRVSTPSHSQEHFDGAFGMLSKGNSDCGVSSNEDESLDEFKSSSSGITIYSDAQESLKDELSRLEEHEQSISWSQRPGLVAVTPLKSTLRDSMLSVGAFDFGLNNVNEGSTTSFAASPQTPRFRRTSPDRQFSRERSAHHAHGGAYHGSSSRRNNIHASRRVLHELSPLPKKAREPLGSLDNQLPRVRPSPSNPGAKMLPTIKSGKKHRDDMTRWGSSKNAKGLKLTLGKPRAPSSNPSIASTHGSSRADSQGHIEPTRKVKEPEVSYVRRVGGLIYTQAPLYAGGPRLPHFPRSGSVERNFGYGGVVEKRDIWGRKAASRWVSVLIMCVCLFFPPLWLLLAVGYFDHLFGPLSRWVKIISLLLSLATLAAGTALVVVFSVVR